MTKREERLVEAQELSEMLVHVAEETKADFRRVVEGLGLPVHLGRAVVRLSAPAPMRELAEQLVCDRSYITSIADQLEERGLVRRVPGEDRRVKLLELTPEGKRLRARISEGVADNAGVLRRLDDEQRAVLRPLLEALLHER